MKYLFAPICAFHMYTVGCEVYYHPSLLLIGLHTIVSKCKLINFNQYNLKVYTYDPHFWPRIAVYLLSVRRNFVVCLHETLLKLGVPGVENIRGTLHQPIN
jgi:hypothetical protein